MISCLSTLKRLLVYLCQSSLSNGLPFYICSHSLSYLLTLQFLSENVCFSSQHEVKVKSLSCVQLFVTPWTVAYQAPLSMGFSRRECWSGLPFPSPGHLPNPGIEPGSLTLQADALPSEPPGKPLLSINLAFQFITVSRIKPFVSSFFEALCITVALIFGDVSIIFGFNIFFCHLCFLCHILETTA